MSDLDSEIVSSPGRVRAALDENASGRTVAGMRAESVEMFDALEQAWAARVKAGEKGSAAVLRQIRRKRVRLSLPVFDGRTAEVRIPPGPAADRQLKVEYLRVVRS